MTAPDLSTTSVAAASLSEVAAIRAAITRLVGLVADARTWPGPDRHRVLLELDHAVDGLTAVRAGVLAAEKEAGTWRGAGDRSVEGWWGRASHVGPRAAAAQVRQADQLAAAPAATAAATEGRIGVQHAAVIGAVVTNGTPAQREAALSPAGQQHLQELAQQQDAATFTTSVAHWAATIDPAGLEERHQANHAKRCTCPTRRTARSSRAGWTPWQDNA